jgi:hypothetical protein
MIKFKIEIYDAIEKSPLEEIEIEAESKDDAIDKAHAYAFEKYSDIRHLVKIKPQAV